MIHKTWTLILLVWTFCGFSFQEPRLGQPIVIEGANLPGIQGAPITSLRILVWDGTNWSQPSFQFDERGPDDSFFTIDDALFDANDVLALQPEDGGIQASSVHWPDDQEARSNPRIEIEVTDPAEGVSTYFYAYQTTQIPASSPTGVSYDMDTDTITGTQYQVGFDPTGAVMTEFRFRFGEIFGGDILDREKIRISGVAIIIPFGFSEDDFNVTGMQVIEGPVRILRRVSVEIEVAGNPIALNLDRYFYRQFFQVPSGSGTISLPGGVSLNAIRISRDFNDMTIGLTSLSDPNNNKINVDGNPDAGVVTTINAQQQNAYWSQFDFDNANLWNAMTFPGLADSVDLYYHDDSTGGTADGTADTGDMVSFGDHGVLFNNPGAGAIQLSFGSYIDITNTLTSAKVVSYIQNPLTSSEVEERFMDSFYDFIALWGTNAPKAEDMQFLVSFVNLYGVPPL